MAAHELLNERAILVRDLPEGYRLPNLESLREALPGVIDAVQAFDKVALFFQEEIPDRALIEEALHRAGQTAAEPGYHELPICFEHGEDLINAARQLSMSVGELADLFVSAEFKVEAIGFSPGFPYLSGLPDRLCGLPRLASPRSRVEAGSVGLAERNACVYPTTTPGGWNLIARTPLQIVDLKGGRFPISVGDKLRFRRISLEEFENFRGLAL